jgi:hypothetical protein
MIKKKIMMKKNNNNNNNNNKNMNRINKKFKIQDKFPEKVKQLIDNMKYIRTE